MDLKRVITTIVILASLAAMGAGASMIMTSMGGTQMLSALSDVGSHMDMNHDAQTVTYDITHPQYGTTIRMPYLDAFDPITTFDHELNATEKYTMTINANSVGITGPGSDFIVTPLGKQAVNASGATATVTHTNLNKAAGLPGVLPRKDANYLEDFFKGFIPFKDSPFYNTILTGSGSLNRTSYEKLAEALFDTWYIAADGTVSSTPAANQSKVTLLGVTRPDVDHVLNIGKISNSLAREKSNKLRYISYAERNSRYIEAIIAHHVFSSTPATLKSGTGVATQAFLDIVAKVQQIPEGIFAVPDKKFVESPSTKLPVIRVY